MEHIPHTRGETTRVQVPYVVVESIHAYDGRSTTFSGFRVFHGFDEQWLQRPEWRSQHPFSLPGSEIDFSRGVESFLQEWLFFGALCEVLREGFNRTDFVLKEQASQWIITTRSLPSLLRGCKMRCTSLNDDEQAQRRIRVNACLSEASAFVNKYLGSLSSKRDLFQLRESVVLSIVIMVDTLSAAAAQIYGTTRFIVTRPQLVDDLLLTNGWCPTTLSLLDRRGFGPQGMYYATLLGPLSSRRDHGSCSRAQTHCRANQVDPAKYQTKHSADCTLQGPAAKEEFQDIDLDMVRAMVKSNAGHPVVVVRSDIDGKLHTKVRNSRSEQAYVAISHVWMDGLGNNENMLPRCQLRRVQQLVNALYNQPENEPIPFWIDTLCVPTKPEEYRRRAISNMASVYSSADKVLVLDANLIANPSASCRSDHTEVLMRITSTNWMRRLWTLQEGVLGKSLYHAFSDGVVDTQKIVISLNEHVQATSRGVGHGDDDMTMYPGQSITTTVLQQYITFFRLNVSSPQDRLAPMWNNMQWRSTSKARDETICMAILLGFSPNDIVTLTSIDAPDIGPKSDAVTVLRERVQMAKRYKIFLQMLIDHQIRIPRALLFTRGNRFDDDSLRWAPSSFFRTADLGTLIAAEPKGHATRDGLHIFSAGFELYLPPTAFKQQFIMLNELTSTFYQVDYSTPELSNSKPWATLAPESIIDPAIVMQMLPDDVGNGALGLLVSITRREQEIFFATYLGQVWVNRWPAWFNWEAVTKQKGEVRSNEMKAGLMGSLWNRRPWAAPAADHPYVTSRDVLDRMTNRWYEDGAALNYELDYIWASSREISPEQKWCIG